MRPSLALWLVCAAFLLLATVYANIVPPLEGFDARAHFRYAGYLHQQRRLPTLDPATVQASYELITQPPLYFAGIALATAPLPMTQALDYARQSENPYHDKSLSLRQTITLPTVSTGVLFTLWVARTVSILGGLVTVIGAYLLVRELLPDQPWLAVATASIVGFTPQFLFTSVTITNDAWVPAVCVITLWLLARTTNYKQDVWGNWVLTGCCAGLAALTKYSCLLIAMPGALLLWHYWLRTGWRRTLLALLWMALSSILVAGFWYLRNWMLYGSLIPLRQMSIVLPTMQRETPMSIGQLIDTIPWLFSSYWGVFVSILAPPAYLNAVTWLMIVGAAGLLLWSLRSVFAPRGARGEETRRQGDKETRRQGDREQADTQHATRNTQHALLFALIWFGCIFAGVLHWTRTITFGEQGRLIHAAAPAFALLMLVGWQAWLPSHWRRWLYMLTPVAFLGLALWPLPTLYENYALPKALTPPLDYDRPLLATFASGMQVLGVDFPNGAALTPGERLPLRLYFTTTQEITGNYTLFLHLSDEQDKLLYQFDGVPVQGRHPTRQWKPGDTFADRHVLTTSAVQTDTLATLSLGFYDYRDPAQRQLVFDQNGTVIGDRLIVGKVRITAAPFVAQPIKDEPIARWQQDIQLIAAHIERAATGAPQIVRLEWQATANVHTDYTVFVQLLDANNQVLAQVDQLPQRGQAPTSTWRRGEVIDDTYVLDASVQTWQRLIIGFYDQQGQRLQLEQAGSTSDYFVLLQREH